MRKTITTTILALAVAGAGYTAESTEFHAFAAGLGDTINAMARAQDAKRDAANAALTVSDGSPVARSYRAAAMAVVVDAESMRNAVYDAPITDAAAIGSALGAMASASAAEAVARNDATRILVVAEMAGTIAADWQGSTALFAVAGRAGEPTLALGMAVERLSVDDEPVVGAIEGVVRVHVPFALSDRLSVGPAFSGRAGATLDGDLVVGLDLTAHAEYSVATGIGFVADLGAGQRATSHAASDIQPTASLGLAFVF